MTSNPDLVIRGGSIADGLGGELYEADIAIADGRIVEVGAHAELVRRPGGLYAYLLSLQSQPTEIAA